MTRRRSDLRIIALGAALAGLLALVATLGHASTAHAKQASPTTAEPAYLPGVVVVGYKPSAGARVARAAAQAGVQRTLGTRASAPAATPGTQVLKLPSTESVPQAIARLRHRPGVAYAVPDYVAHAAGEYIPNDPGRSQTARGWEQLQWNFLSQAGVNAPEAWSNLIADGQPGGRGVVVAILDTGVAYRNWRTFTESPDFKGTKFVDPYDFIAKNKYPLDREGHGTFIAGTVAEATNNGIGVTGLAYGAKLMPVRVLDASGLGDAVTISRGIRYAASHGAQVINLSLEFDLSVTSSDIPDIISAIAYAHSKGVAVVAASGNESATEVAYPAHAPDVISVGATTRDRCLAQYSNVGSGLDLVAPGGGDDSGQLSDPDCNPNRELPGIFQETFNNPAFPNRFGLPYGWYGTSMAAAHVAATAALVIASGVIGRHPSPDQVLTRLEQTAQPLGGSQPNDDYGYGLIDAGAATAPGSASTGPSPSAR